MNTLQYSEMGQRHLSTTWTLIRPRYGQWFVSEIRLYDHDGQVVAMPQRAPKFTSLKSAVGSIPSGAVEHEGAGAVRTWTNAPARKLAS